MNLKTMSDLKKEFRKEWFRDKQEAFREPEYCMIDPDLIFDWIYKRINPNHSVESKSIKVNDER